MSEFYLLGQKISYSLSPIIHAAFCEITGKTYAYSIRNTEECELDDFFQGRHFEGLNVTVPYKIYAANHCDVLSEEAKTVGSVNTIVNKNGKLYGYNTDIAGFEYASARVGFDYKGKYVVVLGSGGASRGVVYAIKKAGAGKISIISRTGKNPDNYECISEHADCDYLINATPVGMTNYGTDKSPVSLAVFKNLKGVFDLIYSPAETVLLSEAKKRNIPNQNGLSMLVAQALYSNEYFTETKYSYAEKKEIIEKVLEKI